MRTQIGLLFLGVVFLFMGCRTNMNGKKASAEHIRGQLEKFKPVVLSADLSRLPANEREALKLLVKASRYADTIFLNQVYEKNSEILSELERSQSTEDSPALDFFRIMFGPWDRLDADKPYWTRMAKPDGANFYPEDMKRGEFENWIKTHPGDKEAFESNFTMIRRIDNGLAAIPYSDFFKDQLIPMTELMKKAAGLTRNASLKAYLESRAKALLEDDYFDSDMKWMDLDGDIEAVIGPYEVYEDKLFGYKAAFESFLCIADKAESGKQKKIVNYLDAMEKALPLPKEMQNFQRGKFSPIGVVHLVYSAGDTKAGVQTAAFNLPNDERVREAKGSKKVMLKNVMQAKFETCWIPIVQTALSGKDLKRVSFDAYFNEVLLHEVSHGLGPGTITVAGSETTVNKALKDLYSTVEECKADVLGVLNTQFLIDCGVLPKSLEDHLYATDLGGMFRSIRFGIDEAHGGGTAIQLNYYLDHGAFFVEPDGKFSVNDEKMRNAVRDLAADLLLIQAKGDYEGAKALIRKYRMIRPEVRAVLDKLKSVPVDIRPVYSIEKEI